MDPEIAALLAAGASALVTAAATDAWQFARRGFVKLFARGEPTGELAVSRRLDALADAIEHAPPEQQAELRRLQESSWMVRLGDLVEEQPDLIDELRTLVDNVRARIPADQPYIVRMENVAVNRGRVYASLNGDVTVHEASTPRQDGFR